MRKLSVPVSIQTITKDNISQYTQSFQACGVDRVFLIGFDPVYVKGNILDTQPEKIGWVVSEFKKVVSEVGFWISAFGHGGALCFDDTVMDPRRYTPIEGISGEICDHGFCPLDENFRKDYGEALERLAAYHPDLIMLDDDFRMNLRPYYMGCFCPAHMKEYYKRIGEEIPRENLEALILTGDKNKYRTEFMNLMGDTLLDFAKELRRWVDRVDSNIRLSASVSQEMWDIDGLDAPALAKAFAGNTKPFLRVAGAPYWDTNIIRALELTRLEFHWSKNTGVEVMSEGDTYKRPRYNVPSKSLELFDLLLIANGGEDGILSYLYDYSRPPEYETGYAQRHIKKQALAECVYNLFARKTPVGIEVFQQMHLIANWDLPKKQIPGLYTDLLKSNNPVSMNLLAKNSIPTCFGGELPLFIVGENAKYIDNAALMRGAILDIKAADILSRRGIDTGFISEEPISSDGEYFIAENDTIRNINCHGLRKVEVKEKAEVLSRFAPSNTPASYKYENAERMRFFVLAFDHYAAKPNNNYFCNYYRQAQLMDAIAWLGGKKLPASVRKNPNLYILASKDESAMAVALANISLDDVLSPVIALDQEYSQIKFLNCTGQLRGDKVYLSDISPYGFAAFEVK